MKTNKISFKFSYTVPGEYTREVCGEVDNTEANKTILTSTPLKSALNATYTCGSNAPEEPLYRWIQITFDPMIGFGNSSENSDTVITKKYRIQDTKENYDRLMASDWILDWEFLDEFDPTIKESLDIKDFSDFMPDKRVEVLKNSSINFKDTNDILLFTEIIWDDLKHDKSGKFSLDSKKIKEYAALFGSFPINAKVWPIEMDLIKRIISVISNTKSGNLELDYLGRLEVAISSYDGDSFPEFMNKIYG